MEKQNINMIKTLDLIILALIIVASLSSSAIAWKASTYTGDYSSITMDGVDAVIEATSNDATGRYLQLTCRLDSGDVPADNVEFEWECGRLSKDDGGDLRRPPAPKWKPCGNGQLLNSTIDGSESWDDSSTTTTTWANWPYVRCLARGKQANNTRKGTSRIIYVQRHPASVCKDRESSQKNIGNWSHVVLVVALLEFVIVCVLIAVLVSRKTGLRHLGFMNGFDGRKVLNKADDVGEPEQQQLQQVRGGGERNVYEGRRVMKPHYPLESRESTDEDGYIRPIMHHEGIIKYRTPTATAMAAAQSKSDMTDVDRTESRPNTSLIGAGHYMEVSLGDEDEMDDCYETPVERLQSPLYENMTTMASKHH